MAANEGKRTYGLIIPKRGAAKKSSLKPNIFGDESDEEVVPVPGKKFGQTNNTRLKTQTQLEIQKALDDDPTVYEYDSIYDDMQQKKIEKNSTLVKGKEKKSRYINHLLKAAEDRKKDDDRRKERTVQKERDEEEAEGLYKDKEEFVTSAYKEKLVEMENEAEEERRKAALEDAMDVTKQKDLSGFYRHFLNQQTGEEDVPDNTRVKKEKDVKSEAVESTTATKPTENRLEPDFSEDRDDVRRTSSESDASSSSSDRPERSKIKREEKTKKSYRKRRDSDDDEKSRSSRNQKSSTSRRSSRSKSRSPKRSRRSKSRSHERSRSPRRSKRSRSPQKTRRSRSRSHERRRDDRQRRRSRSHDRRSRSPPGGNKTESDKHGEKTGDRRSSKDQHDRKKRAEDKENPGVKTSGKDSEKEKKDSIVKKDTVSLADKFAKRNVGTAVEDARARYLARKRRAVVEAEEN